MYLGHCSVETTVKVSLREVAEGDHWVDGVEAEVAEVQRPEGHAVQQQRPVQLGHRVEPETKVMQVAQGLEHGRRQCLYPVVAQVQLGEAGEAGECLGEGEEDNIVTWHQHNLPQQPSPTTPTYYISFNEQLPFIDFGKLDIYNNRLYNESDRCSELVLLLTAADVVAGQDHPGNGSTREIQRS